MKKNEGVHLLKRQCFNVFTQHPLNVRHIAISDLLHSCRSVAHLFFNLTYRLQPCMERVDFEGRCPLLVGQMYNFSRSNILQVGCTLFFKSDVHFMQVVCKLVEGRIYTFCRLDVHFLQVGRSFIVGQPNSFGKSIHGNVDPLYCPSILLPMLYCPFDLYCNI